MNYIGIDPGAKGAIAIIDKNGIPIKYIDMPMVNKNVNLYDINDFFSSLELCEYKVYIEKCQYTPQLRGLGAFTFGKNVMAIESALVFLGLSHEFVRPQVWKKEFGLLKTTKKDSIIKARQLFPSNIKNFIFSKDGRAEAFLIAEYGRRHEGYMPV